MYKKNENLNNEINFNSNYNNNKVIHSVFLLKIIEDYIVLFYVLT